MQPELLSEPPGLPIAARRRRLGRFAGSVDGCERFHAFVILPGIGQFRFGLADRGLPLSRLRGVRGRFDHVEQVSLVYECPFSEIDSAQKSAYARLYRDVRFSVGPGLRSPSISEYRSSSLRLPAVRAAASASRFRLQPNNRAPDKIRIRKVDLFAFIRLEFTVILSKNIPLIDGGIVLQEGVLFFKSFFLIMSFLKLQGCEF